MYPNTSSGGTGVDRTVISIAHYELRGTDLRKGKLGKAAIDEVGDIQRKTFICRTKAVKRRDV